MIYLDHAATSPPLQCAKVAFNAASTAVWGNPNSLHSFGQSSRNARGSHREVVVLGLNGNADLVVGVSAATEACRIALTAMDEACRVFRVSGVEHSAVSSIAERVLYGRRNSKLNGRTFVHTNNETGEIYDLRSAFSGYDLTFSDCTAAMGKQKINFRESGI